MTAAEPSEGPVVLSPVPQRTLAKARTLMEALPYFREHAGSTVVVKVGGAVLEEPALTERLAEDLGLLRLVGVRPVVVHGGGPQITDLSRRLGLEPSFVEGHRVTDAPTLEVARMVLAGKVNEELVSRLNALGVTAVGLSGGDGRLLVARRRTGVGGADLGFVGEVASVNTALLEHLMAVCVPVIATVATDETGQAYNVNADLAAGAVAAALGASKLLLLTDVPGVLQDGTLLSELTASGVRDLLAGGGADGGMVPKLEAALSALEAGVSKVHVLDGRLPHSVILELFTPEGAGTMIVPDGSEEGEPA